MKILEIVQAERDEARLQASKCAAQVRELEIQLTNQRMINNRLSSDVLLKTHRVTLLESQIAEHDTLCKCGSNQHGVGQYFCNYCGHRLSPRKIL